MSLWIDKISNIESQENNIIIGDDSGKNIQDTIDETNNVNTPLDGGVILSSTTEKQSFFDKEISINVTTISILLVIIIVFIVGYKLGRRNY